MLTPSEVRRHSTQSRRIEILDDQIAQLERAAPFEGHPLHHFIEACQMLDDLRCERAELIHRLPIGDLDECGRGIESTLQYDR